MRRITKGREPASLTTYRKGPNSGYEGYRDKDGLRRALVAEQRGLCCYCMSRVRPESKSMKIEHWKCQSHHHDEELKYANLLAACLGGEGEPPQFQHCDTRKGERDLEWNPANPIHRIETRLRYELDGSIRAGEVDFDQQLDRVLNLNLPLLRNNRTGVLKAVLDWWTRERARTRGPVPRDRIVRERDKYATLDGDLTPYCQVAVWWLNQKLERMAA